MTWLSIEGTERMRLLLAVAFAAMVLGGVAQAQTPSEPPATTPSAVQTDARYMQVVAELTFGNVSSQSYAAEAGFTVRPRIQVFAEGGRVNNVAGEALGSAAHVIAEFLARTQVGVTVLAKEPVTFFVAGGIRYLVPVAESRAQPYVMGGLGMARVKRDVTFTVGATDVTDTLQQLGVVLGSDLSGTFTRPVLTFGGGVAVPVWQRMVLDLHYRFGRIFAEEQGINVSRAGIGLGIRF